VFQQKKNIMGGTILSVINQIIDLKWLMRFTKDKSFGRIQIWFLSETNINQNIVTSWTNSRLIWPFFSKKRRKLIWGWHSGWLEILEFAPSKVSGSIPYGSNFGGWSPYKACFDFKRGSRKWMVELVPSN